MKINELCPNCGAPMANSSTCAYCGSTFTGNVKIEVLPNSPCFYENSTLERILDHAIDLQRIHEKIVVDIMEYYGCLGGCSIQVLVLKDKLNVCFILETAEQIKHLSNFHKNRLFKTYRTSRIFCDGYFAHDPKTVANIITQIFAEVYDVNIASLGFHIWSRYKTSDYKDEYFDENGNPMHTKPIQKSTRWVTRKTLSAMQVLVLIIVLIVFINLIIAQLNK